MTSARYTIPFPYSLGKIAKGAAVRDRIEAADRKRVVAAFQAGKNPYEAIEPQSETVEKLTAPKFNLYDLP